MAECKREQVPQISVEAVENEACNEKTWHKGGDAGISKSLHTETNFTRQLKHENLAWRAITATFKDFVCALPR